jgi:hypothetical protein
MLAIRSTQSVLNHGYEKGKQIEKLFLIPRIIGFISPEGEWLGWGFTSFSYCIYAYICYTDILFHFSQHCVGII